MIKYLDNLYIPSGPINYMDEKLKKLAHEGDSISQMKWFKSEWNEYIQELKHNDRLEVVMLEALDVAGCVDHFPDIYDDVMKFWKRVNPLYLEAFMMHIRKADLIIKSSILTKIVVDPDSTFYNLWAKEQKEKEREVIPSGLLQDRTKAMISDALDFHRQDTLNDKESIIRDLQMRVFELSKHFR